MINFVKDLISKYDLHGVTKVTLKESSIISFWLICFSVRG